MELLEPIKDGDQFPVEKLESLVGFTTQVRADYGVMAKIALWIDEGPFGAHEKGDM